MKSLIFLSILLRLALSIGESSETIKIEHRGWCKYYISWNPNEKIAEFRENEAFYRQQSFGAPPPDEYGPMIIPTRNHFFFVMTPGTLYVLSARIVCKIAI